MPRLAVYPGSFDPPTLGHLDVIERAAALFDDLVVAVGRNAGKTPLLTPDERIEAIHQCTKSFPNVRVEGFSGLLIHYAHEIGATSIVRGLRATADFEYEFQMAMVNRRLSSDIETVFLMTRWEYSYLSSSIVKEVATLGGDYAQLVPEAVIPIIKGALERSRT